LSIKYQKLTANTHFHLYNRLICVFNKFIGAKREKMKNADEAHLRRIFTEMGVEDPDYYVKEADEYDEPTPMLSKVVFMRECLKTLIKANDEKWIDEHIEAYQKRTGKKDLYSLRFEPEMPELLTALLNVQEKGVDPKNLGLIVREYQRHVLASVISLIDGGYAFEEGVDSDWGMFQIDDDLMPTYGFGDMKDMIWELDPDKDA